MSKYVVAYINNFDNVLEQKIIEADSDIQAALRFLRSSKDQALDDGDYKVPETMEDLLEDVLNWDANISVIEI